MTYSQANNIAQKYPGMRCKVKGDEIVIYANFFTLCSDIYKGLKRLFR